jgi:hypothetical protein
MRRMTAMNENEQGQPTSNMGDTARELSVSAVRSMTDAAKAALSGMQEIGRTMADMAVPAARRTVKTANEVTRAAMDSTRQLTRSAGDVASQATRSAASGARRATRSAAKSTRRAARSSGRRAKSRRRRAA